VVIGIRLKIVARQFEQCRSRSKAILLKMNKSAGELNQALVKRAIRPVPVCQPQFLQDVVGLIKQGLIKALEIAQVMGVKAPALAALDQSGDLCALFAQLPKSIPQSRSHEAGNREQFGMCQKPVNETLTPPCLFDVITVPLTGKLCTL
jgi:hypothetical protein